MTGIYEARTVTEEQNERRLLLWIIYRLRR